MQSDFLILYTAIITVLSCIIIPIMPSSKKSLGAFFFVIVNALISSISAVQALCGNSINLTLKGGEVFGTIPLRIDALSAWFILIVNLTCINGAWYGIRYMSSYVEQRKNLSLHWSLFVVFHTSMLWVCSVQHGLAFLVVWEIMSISSFLLVIFDNTRVSTLAAGMNYLVQMHIGVICLTIAFIFISLKEGTYDFNNIASVLATPDTMWLFLLFFVGFAIKAGFIPFHTWLPRAHPAAPSHISGVMSGVIVKMGVYGILRMIAYLSTDLVFIGELILALSVATAFYGILNAAIHRDFKRMLAFCTIENIGIIGMGIGLGLIGKGLGKSEIMILGFSAALLHTLNHSLYKSLLFFAAGNIYKYTHTKNMEHLGGLIKKMPVTTFFFLCGSLAICGLPPFNGFVSEFLLYIGLIDGLKTPSFQLNLIVIGSIAGLSLFGGMSLLTFTKSFSIIFLGSPRDKHRPVHRETLSYDHLPFLMILILMLAIGVFPSFILIPIKHIVLNVLGLSIPINDALLTIEPVLSMVGLTSLILILLIGFVYSLRYAIVRKRVVNYSSTWGCGYVAPNARMQYTGKSFSKSLAKLFSFITVEEKRYHEIEESEVFPSHRIYQSTYPEVFEKSIMNKGFKQLLTFMNRFSFIQNGQVQRYILYGFIFIMLLIVATFFNIL
jgi:formate hydrogenlyase subunit 3/multisubunit Na+/H+ antiporter MnhD subunit